MAEDVETWNVGDRVVSFGCREGAGAVVYSVVILDSSITDRVLPMVLGKPAAVEGGSGSEEDGVVSALCEAVFLWRI